MTNPPAKTAELSDRQIAFVENFVAHGCASRAAREAGYSDSTAKQIGYNLLLKPRVAEAVRRQVAARVDSKLPSAVETLATLMTDPMVEPRDRIRAAEVLMKFGNPSRTANPAVAVQVNVGTGASEAQAAIKSIWESRAARETAGQIAIAPPIEIEAEQD